MVLFVCYYQNNDTLSQLCGSSLRTSCTPKGSKCTSHLNNCLVSAPWKTMLTSETCVVLHIGHSSMQTEKKIIYIFTKLLVLIETCVSYTNYFHLIKINVHLSHRNISFCNERNLYKIFFYEIIACCLLETWEIFEVRLKSNIFMFCFRL